MQKLPTDIQAFGIGPLLFRQYRVWRRGKVVVERRRVGAVLLVYWRRG